jgi:hypothetical protein
MSAAPSEEEIVLRALEYPFARPSTSVVVVGDRELELIELDMLDLGSSRVRAESAEGSLADACEDAGVPVDALGGRRTPVLAYGSNASPSGMRWKFPEARQAVTPLLRGTLGGLDVVYSAHIAVYGSVPATLQRSPGTTVETFVALLTEAQLERVAAWEINGRHQLLRDVELTLEGADAPAEVGAFVSRHGCLTTGGVEIALAEVPAHGRRYQALGQPEVLRLVRDRVAPGTALEEFILANVRDYDIARAHTAKLRADATELAL